MNPVAPARPPLSSLKRAMRSSFPNGSPLRVLLAAFLLLLGMAGCSGGCGELAERMRPVPPRPVGGEARFGLAVEPLSFNPLVATDDYSQDLLAQLFPTLAEVRVGPGAPPAFEPALAESWELEPGGGALTFRLRADLFWSDGRPVGAEDVRFTWQAQVDPAVGWPGAPSKSTITDVEVVDPTTVRFRFTHPLLDPVLTAVEGRILPAHVWSKIPFEAWKEGEAPKKHVTCGPYRLEKIKPGEEIVLEPDARRPEALKPAIGKVIFRIFPHEEALLQAALDGDLDLAVGIAPERVAEAKATTGLRVVPVEDPTVSFIVWNTTRPPFDVAGVRRAMTLALDRQSMVDRLLAGVGRVASSPITQGSWASNPALAPLAFDREAAKAELALAGYVDPDGDGWLERDGEKLAFQVLVNEENPLRERVAANLREQLRQIGVQVVIRKLPMAEVRRLAREHEFTALISSWRLGPRVGLEMFHSAEAERGFNFAGYTDPALDRLIDQARSTADRDEARELWREVQAKLSEAQPWTLLFERPRFDLVRERLQGVGAEPRPFLRLWTWWIQSETPSP